MTEFAFMDWRVLKFFAFFRQTLAGNFRKMFLLEDVEIVIQKTIMEKVSRFHGTNRLTMGREQKVLPAIRYYARLQIPSLKRSHQFLQEQSSMLMKAQNAVYSTRTLCKLSRRME